MKNKKTKMFIIPDTLKNSTTKVKFCYLALRNFIYYVDKGMHTQMKYNKQSHDNIMRDLIDNYFKCAEEHSSLSKEEQNLIKECFTSAKKSLIVKDDYIFVVEKELTFKPFAFYCNCLLELSFHVGEDYFNEEYIKDTINELAEKMMVNINDNFIEFIILDINSTLSAIDSIKEDD